MKDGAAFVEEFDGSDETAFARNAEVGDVEEDVGREGFGVGHGANSRIAGGVGGWGQWVATGWLCFVIEEIFFGAGEWAGVPGIGFWDEDYAAVVWRTALSAIRRSRCSIVFYPGGIMERGLAKGDLRGTGGTWLSVLEC